MNEKKGELQAPHKATEAISYSKTREDQRRLPQLDENRVFDSWAQNGVREHSTTVAGCRMRYLIAGDSGGRPPLLLIHGLLGYSFSWRYNLIPLAHERRVIAVDLPGVGYSGRLASLDCSVRATASRLHEFLIEQGISKIDLLGTSHGGGVAILLASLAKTKPESLQINKLALVAPINPWSRHGMLLAWLLSTRLGSASFRKVHPWFRSAHGIALGRMYGDRHRIQPGTLEGYSAPLQIEGTLDHALKIACCLRNDINEVRSSLPLISDVPTLLVWGDRDRAVLPKSAPVLKAQFRDAELAIINGAGHLPYEEFPDEFNRILTEFLRR